MKKKKKISKVKKSFIIFTLVLDLLVALCFFLTYGPMKNFLVTTSMTTMTHKYIAKTFYFQNTIEEVLSNNTIKGFDSGTKSDHIKFNDEIPTEFKNEYEKQILQRDKNDKYKLIEFEYNGYDCFLTAIYDPSNVTLAQTEYLGVQGETLTNIAQKHNAKVAINAGGFIDPNGTGDGGSPMGPVIHNSEITWGNPSDSFEMVGINKDDILVLENTTVQQAIDQGIRDAVNFGPYLIVNGESAKITGNGGWGTNPRTVIAQRKDGIFLFLIVDGNGQNKYNWNGRGGVTLNELIEILKRYDAYNAANMDGGASTSLIIENKLINKPCAISDTGERWLPNGWILK